MTYRERREARADSRIVPNPHKGGFDILHRGDVFWARTRLLAVAVAAVCDRLLTQ